MQSFVPKTGIQNHTGSFHLKFSHCLITHMLLMPPPEMQVLWEQVPALLSWAPLTLPRTLLLCVWAFLFVR